MATVEKPPTKRHARPHPFAWMKRLTNLKGSSSDSNPNTNISKRNNIPLTTKSKKASLVKNNPYPASGNQQKVTSSSTNGHLSFATPPSGRSVSYTSEKSPRVSQDGHQAPKPSNNSAAPTLSTNPDTLNSETGHSRGGISNAASAGMSSDADGIEGSTFSSPSPSVRSMTTTLTTIQSMAPGQGTNTAASASHTTNHHQSNQQNPAHQPAAQFTHQFPSSSPASALPVHLQAPQAGGGHPATYSTATANNILTDNASILTLASSSKRRRRNSIDTNASVRALAPSSVWGGSRESLPLSVLSANVGDRDLSSTPTASGPPPTTAPAGMRPEQRISVYSSSGVAPALTSERNSFYAGKTGTTGDGGSVRSGLPGHGRNDSITGSIGGAGSPLASPRDMALSGRISRRSSGWGEVSEENSDADKDEDAKSGVGKGKDREKWSG
ncbi:MAG: hypothetical protein M1836_005046 [Candelina mexicana]|nr:MAG: hypothetical protein M1836_005046 [Candelina mexicana]